ncbi:hypothetical protein J4446_00670 [Candidatus Woesearchaeota archaeon]|nr:hypothetical protein [Candidatus Woesearchaeota archaeon]
MERQKNFKTIEDYLAELNNEAFVAGVDKSIRITQETGFETGFHMFYDSEVGIFFDDIIIGCKDKLIGHAREKEMSRKWFGRELRELNVLELGKLHYELKKRNITSSMPFPISKGLKTRMDYFKHYEDKDNLSCDPSHQMILEFHTHPLFNFIEDGFEDIEIERTRPSKSDLKSTNINRRTSKYNPVSIIIGLETRDKRKEQFPAFVYQEKDEVLLDETFDFDGIQRGLEITKEELVILKIFKMNPNGILQLYHLANKSYHNFDGKYNLGRGVSLLKTFNLLDGMKSRIY